jgi:hypothetical protein
MPVETFSEWLGERTADYSPLSEYDIVKARKRSSRMIDQRFGTMPMPRGKLVASGDIEVRQRGW